MPCLRGGHSMRRQSHSYCLAGSSHLLPLGWADSLSPACQKPKSHLGWHREGRGEGKGHSALPLAATFPLAALPAQHPAGPPSRSDVTLGRWRRISYCSHKKESCSLCTFAKRKCLNSMGINLVWKFGTVLLPAYFSGTCTFTC